MDNIDWLIKQFSLSRLTPDETAKNFREGGFSEEYIHVAKKKFLEETGRIRYLSPPPMLITPKESDDSWYPGANKIENARFWPALKRHLLEEKLWPEQAVQSLHQSSDRIISWMQSPWAGSVDTRGLVVGYVQSGKTANFTAVIAKAADVGYRFFIVLSGTKTALRGQTQRRLQTELVRLNSKEWFTPTEYTDFQSSVGNVNYFLSPEKDCVLCVVKKNTSILRKLIEWFRGASPDMLSRCPFLIIDDEADEASVNTARNQAALAAPDRTIINKRVVDLLHMLPKAAYLGYTATPFANVLIDPRPEIADLYPKDFIVSLPKPQNHFGTEQIFGRERLLNDETEEEFEGLDMVRMVPNDEIARLKPPPNDHTFVPEVTDCLQTALQYFWLATAVRAVRGQAQLHSTMLIHTTQLIRVHNAMRNQLEAYRADVVQTLQSSNRNDFLNQLRELWRNETMRVPPETMNESPVQFEELAIHVDEVIHKSDFVVDNSLSDHRLNYESGGRIQIAIGGNTLSRGLTLEGLVVSFFVRAASTYDTLLQMGRWFGYRPKYSDLPRIWMTAELRGNFFDLATIEAELRRDIERYAQLKMTPRDFGVRIRTHPHLDITAPLKMQHAVTTAVSYSRNKTQTILFKHRDLAWLNKNLEAADRLIKRIAESNPPLNTAGHYVFRNVQVSAVLEFLEQYQFHPDSSSLDSRLLRGYIKDQNQHNLLQSWNIVVRGVTAKGRENRGTIILGVLEVPLLERARRLPARDDKAHIGVLMSKGDVGLDLDIPDREKLEEEELKQMRQELSPDKGLLVIYPINKDSSTGAGAKHKTALGAVAHVIGLGMVFPDAAGASRGAQRYVTVDPAKLRPADWEYDEEEEEDK